MKRACNCLSQSDVHGAGSDFFLIAGLVRFFYFQGCKNPVLPQNIRPLSFSHSPSLFYLSRLHVPISLYS